MSAGSVSRLKMPSALQAQWLLRSDKPSCLSDCGRLGRCGGGLVTADAVHSKLLSVPWICMCKVVEFLFVNFLTC